MKHDIAALFFAPLKKIGNQFFIYYFHDMQAEKPYGTFLLKIYSFIWMVNSSSGFSTKTFSNFCCSNLVVLDIK